MDWIRNDCKRRIYSTANLKDGTHQLSIPWAPQRGGTVANALARHPDAVSRAEAFVELFKQRFPALANKVSYSWHVVSGLYLSLRVAPLGNEYDQIARQCDSEYQEYLRLKSKFEAGS